MDFDQFSSSSFLVLAQEGGPPAGREAQMGSGETSTPGTPTTTPPPQQGLGGQLLWMMIILFGGMILFSILATRRDRKKREAMLTAVRKHDRVQTIGGVIGSVVDVKESTIVLKVDESTNTRITLARSAVQQILSADSDTPSDSGMRSELEESAR